MMGSGMSAHEWRGPHRVHDRAEKAEANYQEIEAFITKRKQYWHEAGFDDVATELSLILVKMYDVKNS